MSKHSSKMLIFSLLACASTTAHAGVVSVEDAKQLASEFFSAGRQDKLAADALELAYTAGTASKPIYYVFNANEGNGFVIVSADDCTTPVLGYSFENPYVASQVPDAMKWMLAGVEKEIKAASTLQKPVAAAERRRAARKAAAAAIGNQTVLATPSWSQESPFNSMIPGRPLVGCVGTAMAEIMRYHKFPAQGTGSFDGVNFDVAYDWDNMRMDNYRSGYSTDEANAVATLLWHAAKSVDTQFGMSGSSAYEVRVPAALTNYFNYDPGVSYKKRADVGSQQAWDKLVVDEINAGRPVLYCGQDVTAGHAFVCDGYNSAGYLHFNWGWGGAANGFFLSTALNPTVSMTHNFNNLNTIIYNIKPGKGDNAAWSTIHITADGRQTGMGSDLSGDLTADKKFNVRVGNLKNVSYTNFSGKIAVALFAADGTFKTLLSNMDGLTLTGMAVMWNSYADFSCRLPEGTEVADGDMIRMATSTDNGATWLPVAGELLTTNEIPAKGAEPQYFTVSHTSPLANAEFTGEDKVIHGWNYRFRVVPAYPERDVVTVKANGYVLTPDANYNYSINNVLENQNIAIYVQPASEVKEKRSVWVNEPGTLETILSGADAGTVKQLTLFGAIDARDFAFMRSSMKLTSLDLSSVRIAANGANQANAIPREAFRGLWNLKKVVLPNSVNRLNNGCFRSCGITEIVIPASVTTYEYNVFNGSSGLKDVWVNNPNPVFVNWCVFYGTPKNRTLHCPNDASVSKYTQDQYWNSHEFDHNINIVSGVYPTSNDVIFAVMENDEVKYDGNPEPGNYAKGTAVTFSAEHIAENDNRMEVYAGATLLKPDAQGNYSVTLNSNTIIHFELIEPTPVNASASYWQLTNTGGTVGLLTDAVNVIPGQNFTIRANALYIPEEYKSMFWAAVLTDSNGNIKEFISPVNIYSSASGDGLKMNINCCVKESTVREGNLIRLATSFNKNTWSLVEGRTDDVIDALPALNNTTPIYNFTFPEGMDEKLNLSGIVESAVRGRDLTFKFTPKSAANVINMLVNGKPVAKEAKSVNYSFIAKEDLNFEINVISPDEMEAAVFDLQPGERLWDNNNKTLQAERLAALRPRVVVKGNIDYTDLGLFRQTEAWNTVVSLDLSGATIVADRSNPNAYPANQFPANAFCLSSTISANIKLKDLKFPPTVKAIGASALYNCSKITELELPAELYNDDVVYMNGKDREHQGGLKRDCFKGCDNLVTLFCYAVPKGGSMVHHIDFNSVSGLGNDPKYYPNNLGLSDPTKVTVVVLPEYFKQYTTPHSIDYKNWRNGWVINKFNIVSEYPVYSLNYDPTRCFITDKNFKNNAAASFLGDNVTAESINIADKLYVGVRANSTDRPADVDAYNAAQKVKIYDNGSLMPETALATNGSLGVTFHNPNKRNGLSGNHEIKVVYLYDVTLTCTSNLFTVIYDARNNEDEGDKATLFEQFNYYNALAPVVENVTENSVVRFRLEMDTKNHENLEARVKLGDQVITMDDEGYYNVEVTDRNLNVEIFAVPVNGATLNQEEFNSVDAKEAVDITSIALEGEISEETLNTVVESFTSLKELDLTNMNGEIPAGTFNGKNTLTSVALPAITTIEPETFKGCSNLSTISIPESVSAIGANAFQGCTSLGSISLTGINTIGAGAFNGCDNLTSITLLAPKSASARHAASRAAGFDAQAFEGLNPNCLIILDENIEVPAADGNYIATAKGTVTETMPDGTTSTREGRIYTTAGDITLQAGYPFSNANAFNVKETDAITFTCPVNGADENGNWSALLLPFDASTVTLDGNMLAPSSNKNDDTKAGSYTALTLASSGEELERKSSLAANTPYLIRLASGPAAQQVKFSAIGQTTVEATPDEIKVSGNDYDLVGTYQATEATATTYVLNEQGSAFVKVEPEIMTADESSNAATTTMAPFSVYAVSESGAPRIDISVADNLPTGVEAIGAGSTQTTLSFSREGNTLVIYAKESIATAIYSVDGRLIGTITLTAGRNVLNGLSHGTYLIAGTKVTF